LLSRVLEQAYELTKKGRWLHKPNPRPYLLHFHGYSK
jgi:hypothetical protein